MLKLCVIFSLAQVLSYASNLSPPCFSDIYCHGELLHTVQMNRFFEDSKTFVDMKIKSSPNQTMQNFLKFMEEHNHTPDRTAVKKFVFDNFDPAGSEFEDWIPSDWVETPKFTEKIVDPDYKSFALSLNYVWKDLGRKMKDEVKENKELYSIIWVPNPVIVPGGRFREFYYWDSYWIVQGLLLSKMDKTVHGMLENFAYIVDEYGHIPNGGRVYYMQRSQPPLFIPMVKLYVDETNDFDFVKKYIDTFEKEIDFWLVKHKSEVVKNGKNYTLLAYGDNSSGPRPESYLEDYNSASFFKTETEKEKYYSELKAAAESGWDFSSRWFVLNGTNKGNLTNIETRSIIPVDLNALFYWNVLILSEWHQKLGNQEKFDYFSSLAEAWVAAVEEVLWVEDVGAWLDYDVVNGVNRNYFFPTNIAPLWTGCYDKSKIEHITRLILKYLQENDVLHPGGIPTSLEQTGEQWDYPNAWPPLQHMMIVGLDNTGQDAAKRLALEIADRWVRSNYVAHNETEAMFEKYDARTLGGHGGGGEYEVQLGFGWTNGVILDLLDRYGNVLKFDSIDHYGSSKYLEYTAESKGSVTSASFQVLTGLVALAVGCLGMFIYKMRNGQGSTGKKNLRPPKTKYMQLKNLRTRTGQ